MFPALHQLFDAGRLKYLHFYALDDIWFGEIIEKGTHPGEFLVEAWNEDDLHQNFRVQCETDLENVNYDETLEKNLRSSRLIRCHALVEGGGKDIVKFNPKSSERQQVYFEYNPVFKTGYIVLIGVGLISLYLLK